MSQQTVTINGTTYDTHTGLPIQKNSQQTPSTRTVSVKPQHSHEIHRQTQRSHTLNRRIVKKDVPRVSAPIATPALVRKSPAITKFAAHPTGVHPRPRMMDVGPSTHPTVKKVHERIQATAVAPNARPTAPKPSAMLKQEAVHEALHKAPSHAAAHKPVKKQPKQSRRLMSVASASLALLMLGGYFTYLNMPNLSVRVAAAQAGVNANYPSYRPDGYSRGVVGYQDGEVSMKFASNAGPHDFTISQQKTTWDSTAVKENFVDKNWGDNIDIVTERGLTIYRKEGNAVWVNGGILYKIDGNAPLSPTQIRNIASSM